MSRHLMLILFWLFVNLYWATCSVSDSGNLWRANQETLTNEARLYLTRLPIQVEYLGDKDDFVMWGAPAHCVASNDRKIATKMSCNMAGVLKVKLVYREKGKRVTVSRPLIMKKSPLCYGWYVRTFVGSEDINGAVTEMVVRVWIWDPLLSGQSEVLHTATTPSPFSLTLTKVFADKGQVPRLTEILPDPRSEWDWTNGTFDYSHGYWEFNMKVTPSLTRTALVMGKPNIAAHGCFIRDTKALVPWPNTDRMREMLQSKGSVALRGQHEVTMVITDACDRNTAFLILDERCVTTLDGFLTSDDVNVPSSLYSNETTSCTDIAITSSATMFLLSDGSVLVQERRSGTFTMLEVPDNTPLLAIQGKQRCQHSETHMFENDIFIGWTLDSLYIWQGGNLSDIVSVKGEGLTTLPNPYWMSDEEHFDVSISSAGFTPEPMEVAILVKLTTDHQSVSAFVKWNMKSSSWTDARTFFFHQKREHDTMSFINTYGSEENLIFWDKMSVYYSYTRGSDIAEMPLFNDPDESEVEPRIKQLVMSVSGYIIVLSSNNILYTSQVYQESLIRHFSLATVDSELAIYANQIDAVYMLYFESSVLKRVSYSLKPEIKTIVDHIDFDACQYIFFEQCPQHRVYYLDVRDEVVVWAELIHPSVKYNDIKTVVTIPEKLSIKETVHTDFYPGRRSVKKVLNVKTSFTFAQPSNYSEAVAAASGFVTMEMRPYRLGVGCRSPHNMVSHLEMGCPPNRHIRVQKPAECDDVGSFTIDEKAYFLSDGREPVSEKVVHYDKAVYGCPVTVSVKDDFKPMIKLYDDDFLVENMTANYVMWEESRRHDFDYTSSMKGVGCLQEAQTWDRMKAQVAAGSPLKDIWGPHNYESCFIYKVTELQLLRNSYQVLNQSGDNEIKWLTAGDNNLFLFTIQVVDPYYSFCHLETKIGVIVLGKGVVEDPGVAVLRITLGTFAGITGSLLLISYFVYRRIHIRELADDIQENYEDKTKEDEGETEGDEASEQVM